METYSNRGQSSLQYTDNGLWVQIQRNTFTNWLNEQLKAREIVIHDIRTDFSDGVNLVALVEALQHRRLNSAVKQPLNQYEKLQNITVALDAIASDGVRIVNIDSTDIAQGDLKLVLALIWQIVLRYQVGLSAVQHRQWILKWLQAVIPECHVRNFTTDWNDGIALSALLEFCEPGLCPNWRRLDRDDKLNNCRNAIKIARQHFGIPLILRPEDLCSRQLDDRSAITYLSYFIMVSGPGYNATLKNLQYRIRNKEIRNFTTDWHDGRALCELVKISGGSVPGWPELPGPELRILKQGIEGGQGLGVEPILSPEEIAEETEEHIGIMAYAAQYLPLTQLITSNGYNDPSKVTVYDDETSSAHTSTLTSASMTPSFHLVGRSPDNSSSLPGPRVDFPSPESYKIDIYSVGVIIETKLPRSSFDPEQIRVEAEAPSGRIIKMTGDGHYTAQFLPNEIGQWRVALYYKDRFLDGCPIDVCDPSQVRVRDLRGGVVGKAQYFHVDCTNAGEGDLGVDITHHNRRIPVIVSQPSKGLYKANYTPYDSGPYEINVHFNRAEIRDSDFNSSDPEDRQRKAVFFTKLEQENGKIKVKASCDWEIDYMTGGPFVCHVTDSSDIQVYGMQDGTICSAPQLIADCTKVGDGDIDADVTYNGNKYPAKVKKDKPGVYRISFKPRGPGVYRIWIMFDGRPVKGSPFIQEIDELRSPSASGPGLQKAIVDHPASFEVDPRGFPGTLSVNVNGPTYPIKSSIEPQSDGTLKVHYTPAELGKHLINVRMDGKDIDKSPYRPMAVDPYKVRVSGGWRPLVDDRGIIPLVVDKEKHIPFDASEAGPGELTAEVRGPTRKIPVAIDTRNDGKNTVIFTPREEGKHDIDVFWGGFPLANSPFTGYATYRPNDEPDDYGVRLVQIPLNRSPQTDNNYSPRQSTVGSVVGEPLVSIHGSEPSVYRPVSRPPTQTIIYPKRYTSPPVSPTARKPLKVVLSGRGLKEATVDKEANFFVDGTKAGDGVPDADLSSVRAKVPVKIEPVRPNVYKCTYVPKQPGGYLLNLKWNKHPLKGSPFKVSVREPPKPKNVALVGDGLKGGVLGKDVDLRIDPRQAGPGELTAKCTGPHGEPVPCKLIDNFDGTRRLKITPNTVGHHIVEIKYAGDHIHGSPYALDIKASQVIGHVKVWGPGIENGVLNDFKSHFWVDATGAGAGELRVRIMGPKGAFHVKMRKASQKDKVYQCFYSPVEAGIYTIYVQWSGTHVEGSPFTVLLANNQREIDRMHEDRQSHMSSQHSPRDGRDVLY